MTGLQRPCPVPGYHLETLDGEIVLFNPASEQVIHSNRTGALIWQMCDCQRSVPEITELLAAAYPESAQEIASDVFDTLERFAKHGAITWVLD
ncbi:MAG TPA: PqqD family protein [Ardenticatenaceae bacterium]|nr:PqqD family protein [Ardenticatenaceae bacterium]